VLTSRSMIGERHGPLTAEDRRVPPAAQRSVRTGMGGTRF
jgi:hypothetical protein